LLKLLREHAHDPLPPEQQVAQQAAAALLWLLRSFHASEQGRELRLAAPWSRCGRRWLALRASGAEW
jgi:hypothetical protein